MSERKLRVALIGTGAISHSHADAIGASKTLALRACWNRREEREKGDAFARQYGIGYYSSVDEMLDAEKPDVTVNALAYRHHDLGMEEAAARGSHLVVEKPMGVSLSACRKLLNIADRHKVSLSVSESSWFNGVNLTCQSLRERFGAVAHMIDTNFRNYFSASRSPWAFDPVEGFGGMILNVGVHRIARLRLLAGAEESSVCAVVGKRRADVPVEGDASILVRYKNGACGVILMCGYHNTGKTDMNICRIVTDNGYVTPGNPILFVHADGTEERIAVADGFSRPDYENFYTALAASITTGGQAPYSGERGMRDVAVVLAAFASFSEKREIDVDEFINRQS